MDMNLFKETVSQHSVRLKEENIKDGLNNAIVTASYYSENALKSIDDTISLFKEKASIRCTEYLYREGLSDIGKAIWKAIVGFCKSIIRIAVNVKMWFLKGEQGLLKRIARIKDKLASYDKIDISLPVMKGTNGIEGFDKLMDYILKFASGDAYLSSYLKPNGEMSFGNDNNEEAINRRGHLAEILNSISSPNTAGMSAKAIEQDGSLVDVFAAPLRYYSLAMSGSADTVLKLFKSDKVGIDDVSKYVLDVRSGVAKKGINSQLLKDIGITDGKLKSMVDFQAMKGLSKRDVMVSLDMVSKNISTSFAKTEKGNVRKGTHTKLNFEDSLRTILRDSTKTLAEVTKKSKANGVDPDILTMVQTICKASANVLNVVLKDYMDAVTSIKVMLVKILKALEKDTKSIKPIKVTPNMTDSFSMFKAMAEEGAKDAKSK